MVEVFKIRRLADGKFSTGGCSPKFTDRGKVWRTAGHAKSAVTLARAETFRYRRDRPDPYYGCELVTYRLEKVGAILL